MFRESGLSVANYLLIRRHSVSVRCCLSVIYSATLIFELAFKESWVDQ